MRSRPSTRRLAAAAASAAIIGMVGLSACGTEEKAPETTSPTPTTTTTMTTPPPVAPTEKQVTPGGANSFTPTHVEPAVPPTGRHGIGSPHRQ
ncbi:hypothetical protein [Mycobacterium syngnathidarum]